MKRHEEFIMIILTIATGAWFVYEFTKWWFMYD